MSELEGFEVLPTFDQRTNKGKIGFRDKRIAETEQRVEQLESLVRDMYALSKAPTPYTPAEVVAYMDMAESIDQRMAALGLTEVDE